MAIHSFQLIAVTGNYSKGISSTSISEEYIGYSLNKEGKDDKFPEF